MNMIVWVLDKIVKVVAPYWKPPEIPQSVSNPDWPENYDRLFEAFKDLSCPEDMMYDRETYDQALRDVPSDYGRLEGLIETTIEWGLELPRGEVQWKSWSGIDFSTPLDRMRMIATLQKTALDMGLNANGQSDEFLTKYKWQTREKTARIRYKNTGTFSLNDPAVSAAPVENSINEQSQDDSETHVHSYRNLHPGSVGGDA
jgi:hypothetical protein